MIRDPKHLWTEFGLRSLSLSDPYFGTGENYWKGPIWLNINYLVLASLHNNYINEGPHSAFAKEVYTKLRSNLISNMVKVAKNFLLNIPRSTKKQDSFGNNTILLMEKDNALIHLLDGLP